MTATSPHLPVRHRATRTAGIAARRARAERTTAPQSVVGTGIASAPQPAASPSLIVEKSSAEGAAVPLPRIAQLVPATVSELVVAVDAGMRAFAVRHALTVLRVALAFVFILFGALKFFPGLSPAQGIATDVMTTLTFGLLPAGPALLAVAIAEVGVGLCLIANRWLGVALWFLAFEMIAILSPLVLFPGQLFSGPHHLPSLLGQYILKDFVLVGGVLVLFAHRRGGSIRALDTAPSARTSA